MNVVRPMAYQKPAFLDGKLKRMLIGGKWLEAVSGKTFESRNPATGELLANVAEGDAEDINLAVAAARAAFNGPWSKFKPAERQRLLLRLADLVERDIEEFAALDTLDMGAPISSAVRRPQNERLRPRIRRAHVEEYLNVKSVWIKTD